MYSNLKIQPESEGSTQGYPLVSVEVLRFDTLAGNLVKEILLLKLNLPDHRSILTDSKKEKKLRCKKVRNADVALKNKDQIGSFFYFPSLGLQKAAGGYGGIKIDSSPCIPVPFPFPARDHIVLALVFHLGVFGFKTDSVLFSTYIYKEMCRGGGGLFKP
ncbi:hypothetical protein Tco_1229601 [Tanacetum coccineum]